MALIKCPECGNEISSIAVSCPKCGYPINGNAANGSASKTSAVPSASNAMAANEPFPKLPTLMDVGKQLSLFSVPEITDAYFVSEINATNYIPEGKVNVAARTNGISIHFGFNNFPISYDQIIELKSVSHQQLSSEGKSILGRAAVGWLLLGPAGAIVGGLAGLGSKTIGNYLFTITFWDVYTHKAQTIFICTKKSSSDFIKHVEAEKKKQNTPDGYLFVCNILDNKGQISDDKVIEALKKVGKEGGLSQAIQRIDNCDKSVASEKIDQICSRNNVDITPYKSSGCMVTLLLMMTGILSLLSIILIVL